MDSAFAKPAIPVAGCFAVKGGRWEGFPKSLDFKHKKITEKGPNRLVAFGFVVVLVVAIGVYIYM